MLISKRQVVQILRDQGRTEQAGRAERELPVEVDTVHDADLLRELGIDPDRRAQGGAPAVLPVPGGEGTGG